jgi:3-methyl-2-oxobutanoate hydroxymethyltransferase
VTTRMTLPKLFKMKKQQTPISCLTCYDASFAYWFDQAELDVLLIGDSLGQVIQGHDSTIPVTLEDMCYHTHHVSRVLKQSFLMADIPFLQQADFQRTLHASQALMQAGAQMVKMEGGRWLAPTIERLSQLDIPVCAHLGYTPQSIHTLGGPKLMGRTAQQAQQLLTEAQDLVSAGACMLIVECVPDALGQQLSNTLPCPVIGIGAGPDCDGQILVNYDIFGLTPGQIPPFAQCFLTAQNPSILKATQAYRDAVRQRTFPRPRIISKKTTVCQ